MSRPIVVIVCMARSSESWEPLTAPAFMALTCRWRSRPQHHERTWQSDSEVTGLEHTVLGAQRPPPVLPDFLADQAGHPRLFVGSRDDPAVGSPACDLEQELGPDRLLELVAILDQSRSRKSEQDDK